MIRTGNRDMKKSGKLTKSSRPRSLAVAAAPAAVSAAVPAGPVAFLGPAATFSHQAALRHFGETAHYLPCASIAEVFDAVAAGKAARGVVPVENSTEGAVSYTLDMFADSPVRICAEVYLPIHHHLLCRCAATEVRVIYSHPHVFGQCRKWLQATLPYVPCVDVSSTTDAARRAGAELGAGALAGELAACEYKVPIKAQNVEDSAGNLTRFFVIGSGATRPTGDDKTSLLFGIRDRVGALLDSLEPFRRNGVNMSFIESRPSRKANWQYQFYVDVSGHAEDAPVQAALRELEELCQFVKCLGSYPRAALPEE